MLEELVCDTNMEISSKYILNTVKVIEKIPPRRKIPITAIPKKIIKSFSFCKSKTCINSLNTHSQI